MSVIKSTILVSALLASTTGLALAQQAAPAPGAAWTVQEAIAHLGELGLTNITLDETEERHYEFDARDSDGREVDIEIGFDGTIRQFDVDDDRRADTADLMMLLPEDARQAAASRGIVEVTEYDRGARQFSIEGYGEDGREIEVEFAVNAPAGAAGGSAGTDVDIEAATSAVEAAGYSVREVEREPRHLEMLATNPEGENVRLHTDFAGAVNREILVR